MKNLRRATKEDFKEGTNLITPEGYCFVIKRKYNGGIWEAIGTEGQGEKCVFESDIYFIKN